MIFLSLLCAFLLEQARPQGHPNAAERLLAGAADRAARHFNAGQPNHGVLGWCVVMVPLCGAVIAVDAVLSHASSVLGWVWTTLVLYYCLSFRQSSQPLADIGKALREQDIDSARRRLSQWRGASPAELDARDVARLALEEGLGAAHRHIFAPMLLAVVFGPAGAVLHRAARLLLQRWHDASKPELAHFGHFARRAYGWIDLVPSRLTAAGFAIAGNFEDAFYCWRTQAARWPDPFHGAVLASGAGALSVRLGGPLRHITHIEERPELGLGEEPDADVLESALGLIWRATVLWMIVILIISIARLAG